MHITSQWLMTELQNDSRPTTPSGPLSLMISIATGRLTRTSMLISSATAWRGAHGECPLATADRGRTGRAKSVLHFDARGSVAKSTHAGIPWLRFIRQRLGSRVHFWPLDGWDIPTGRSAIAEVYPALWSPAFDRQGRTGDQHDAFSIAAWLSRADYNGWGFPARSVQTIHLKRQGNPSGDRSSSFDSLGGQNIQRPLLRRDEPGWKRNDDNREVPTNWDVQG